MLYHQAQRHRDALMYEKKYYAIIHQLFGPNDPRVTESSEL
jgi:hypothetical protein